METISLKVEENMLKKIDKAAKTHNFGTRTEFVRTAVREKLEKLSTDDLIREFMKTKGAFKGKKTTDEDIRKIKEKASEELLESLEKRFS
ncbi:unnamed protein product [marine sediment metagenome]|uniref:Ribbon-helix-helix protein CopG domain-containing protein n=1 Tax=marine sediment metagenome TaxID=412755 RepID=X0SU26_9ZZZZ